MVCSFSTPNEYNAIVWKVMKPIGTLDEHLVHTMEQILFNTYSEIIKRK